MAANTLYDYFKSQGQALPSVQQRRQQYGLGNDYIGTASQNSDLLRRLQSGVTGSQGATTVSAEPAQPDYLAQASAIYKPVFNPTNYNMDYFSEQAKKLYEPMYAPLEKQTTEQYDQAGQRMAEDLQAEFSRRGILNSGIYGEQLAKSKTSLETQRAAALAKIAIDRLNVVNNWATNQYNTQQDTNQKYTQQVQNWINTKMAQDMQQRQYEDELRLSQQKARSSGSSSAKKQTEWEYKKDMGVDLQQSIAGAVNEWYKRESDRMRNGEGAGYESEEIYLPTLKAAYGQYFKPEEIESMFYSARRPYESKVRR